MSDKPILSFDSALDDLIDEYAAVEGYDQEAVISALELKLEALKEEREPE